MKKSVIEITPMRPAMAPLNPAKYLSSHGFFTFSRFTSPSANRAVEAGRRLMPRSQHKPAQAAVLTGAVRERSVLAGFKCFVAPAALAMAVALCGCSSTDYDTKASWFSKPVELFGNKGGGYSYSNLDETAKKERPITANDLIDANGGCPLAPSVAAAPPPPPAPTAAANTDGSAALSSDLSSLISGGVAINMSECDVVGRLGRPTGINFGKNPNGFRSAVLTYNAGPRPGVYRFEGGRLVEMDRIEAPPAPPGPAKKIAKKKPVKPKEPSSAADKT
jgi:hypothetical protein